MHDVTVKLCITILRGALGRQMLIFHIWSLFVKWITFSPF